MQVSLTPVAKGFISAIEHLYGVIVTNAIPDYDRNSSLDQLHSGTVSVTVCHGKQFTQREDIAPYEEFQRWRAACRRDDSFQNCKGPGDRDTFHYLQYPENYNHRPSHFSGRHLHEAVKRNFFCSMVYFFLDIHNILCFKDVDAQHGVRCASIGRNLWVSFFTTLPRAQKARLCQS